MLAWAALELEEHMRCTSVSLGVPVRKFSNDFAVEAKVVAGIVVVVEVVAVMVGVVQVTLLNKASHWRARMVAKSSCSNTGPTAAA